MRDRLIPSRRGLLKAAAGLVAFPAIVRAESLMKVVAVKPIIGVDYAALGGDWQVVTWRGIPVHTVNELSRLTKSVRNIELCQITPPARPAARPAPTARSPAPGSLD